MRLLHGAWQEEFGTAIGALTFAPDSEQLITTLVPTGPPDPAQRTGVVSWDWRTGDVEILIDIVSLVAIPNPTGHLIATPTRQATGMDWGETVDVWDPTTERSVATLAGNTGGVPSLALAVTVTSRRRARFAAGRPGRR